MTLTELLVVVGMVGFFAIGMSTLFVRIQNQYKLVSQKITQEVDAIDLAFNLKRYISGGVELQLAPITGPVSNLDGRIIAYRMEDTWAPTPTPAVPLTLAAFYRDELKTNQSPLTSGQDRFLPTALFFIPPTPTRYGVLAFNLGDKALTLIDGKKIDLRFTHIVNLEIKNFVTYPSDGKAKVASFQIAFTKRIFQNERGDLKWCPASQMNVLPACVTESTYRDITRNVDIVVRNNALGFSDTRRIAVNSTDPDITGTLMSTQIYVPAVRRAVDGVYMLRPDIPIMSVRR